MYIIGIKHISISNMIYELGEACMNCVDGHILSQSMFIGSPYNTLDGKSVGFGLGVGLTPHTQLL